MITINTKDLDTRKKVEIDGHPFTVRQMGGGDELRQSQSFRRVTKLQEQILAIANNKKMKSSEKEKKVDELQLKIHGVRADILDIYAGLFDDGGDGSKSKELINGLSYDEIRRILSMIFNPEPPKANKDGENTADSQENDPKASDEAGTDTTQA